jgi:hypothetical protein
LDYSEDRLRQNVHTRKYDEQGTVKKRPGKVVHMYTRKYWHQLNWGTWMEVLVLPKKIATHCSAALVWCNCLF